MLTSSFPSVSSFLFDVSCIPLAVCVDKQAPYTLLSVHKFILFSCKMVDKYFLSKERREFWARHPGTLCKKPGSQRPKRSGPALEEKYGALRKRHRGQEHPSQPKEVIRVWACFSSARRTWNLSAERDMETGWARAPGAGTISSCRCTMGSSTERSRLELRV